MLKTHQHVEQKCDIDCPRCGYKLILSYKLYQVERPATPNEPPHISTKPFRVHCRACSFAQKLS